MSFTTSLISSQKSKVVVGIYELKLLHSTHLTNYTLWPYLKKKLKKEKTKSKYMAASKLKGLH